MEGAIARRIGFVGIGVVAVLVPGKEDCVPKRSAFDILYMYLKGKGLYADLKVLITIGDRLGCRRIVPASLACIKQLRETITGVGGTRGEA